MAASLFGRKGGVVFFPSIPRFISVRESVHVVSFFFFVFLIYMLVAVFCRVFVHMSVHTCQSVRRCRLIFFREAR